MAVRWKEQKRPEKTSLPHGVSCIFLLPEYLLFTASSTPVSRLSLSSPTGHVGGCDGDLSVSVGMFDPTLFRAVSLRAFLNEINV